jgi:phenylacetate-CoA ligase
MTLTPLQSWIAQKIGQRNNVLSRADIEHYQLERLNETLRLISEKSSFYREHLAGAPTQLSSLNDIVHLPFTTSADIATDPFRFLCVSQDEISRVVTLSSSGTTGEPKRLYFTREDQDLTIDFFQIGMSTLAQPGDRVLILLPGQTPGSVGDLLQKGLARLGAIGIKHGPVQDAAQTLRVIKEEQVNVLVGIPTHVLRLARHPQESKISTVTRILLSTDHVPDALSRVLEERWNCQVFNHYGMTEMGLGGGVECSAHHGYHLREADLYFEIIDPITGHPLPGGAEGEVVFTTLTRRGMPLLRYRTGDLSRFQTEPCPCGTVLKTLAQVKHRIDGFVRMGCHFQVDMATLNEVLFPIDGVLDFSVRLERHGGEDWFRVLLNTIPGAEEAAADAVKDALRVLPAITNTPEENPISVHIETLAGDLARERAGAKRRITDLRP